MAACASKVEDCLHEDLSLTMQAAMRGHDAYGRAKAGRERSTPAMRITIRSVDQTQE